MLSNFLGPLLCSCKPLRIAPSCHTGLRHRSHRRHRDTRCSNWQGPDNRGTKQMVLWIKYLAISHDDMVGKQVPLSPSIGWYRPIWFQEGNIIASGGLPRA